MKTTRSLYVKKTSAQELTIKWGILVAIFGSLYARCNSKGIVNWNKTTVYDANELIERNNVFIIK